MEENTDKLAGLHDWALRQFDNIISSVRDEREQSVLDRRFYSIAGAQWEGPLSEQYENKPKFEVNKIHRSVMRIISDYRQNRLTVDYESKTGKKDELAGILDGLYRADEQNSNAKEAYDNALEEGVGGGIGAWRYRACYEDEEDYDNDKQRIYIEPIHDADSNVFFDINSKRKDKQDAKHCFVLNPMSFEAYKEEYGDDPASFPKEIQKREFDWSKDDVVYVAELYVKEEVKCKLLYYKDDITGEEIKYKETELDEDEKLAEVEATATFVRSRTVKETKVHKYILSGDKVLEDCGFIAGKYIPIVPYYGKRWVVDNIERAMGHVRLAKDAQRLKNMQLSKLGEISALGSVSKPILTPEQIQGNEVMWSEDNIRDYPYLLVNPIIGPDGQQIMQPISYTKTAEVPPALAALMNLTEIDMKEILGEDGNLGTVVSHTSDAAMERAENRVDLETEIYISNLADAMVVGGKIWLSMAKEVYADEKREMKIVNKDGESEAIQLMKPGINEKGEIIIENDISKANMDITVSVGPSSDTRRSKMLKTIEAMMQYNQDPELHSILSAMGIMLLDGEGMADVKEFVRKRLVRMGAAQPTEQDMVEMQAEMEQQTNAQEDYIKAATQRELAEAQKMNAETFETVANAGLKEAQTQKAKAETAETVASIERDDLRAVNEAIKQDMAAIQPFVNE